MTIEEVVKNKVELMNIKKLAIKHSDGVSNQPIKTNSELVKAIQLPNEDDNAIQKVIANTYYWMDSHYDVHVKGIFTKSIKENANKIYHLDNHDSSNGFRSKVGNVKSIVEQPIPWSSLGVNKSGETIALIGSTELIEDYNCQVFDAYNKGEIDQHSVGMIYVDMVLAVNSPEYVEEFKVWNEIFPLLGNQSEATKVGYFWVIKQAKLKEFSCVLWDGSNSLTPAIKTDIEPSKDTHKEEPEKSTQKANINHLLI